MNRTIIIKIKKNNITYSNVNGYQTAGTTLFGLSAGSASIERILCDKQLEFGVCNSAKFEAQIFNIATDVTDCQIEVLASDVTDPIFVGKIDSSKKDETNEYRNIIAYDNLYTARDKDIAEAWNGTDIWEDENPITLKTLRNRLCAAAGLTVSTSQPTLPNDNESIPARFATFTSAKFGTIIKMVCELQGSFPIITADGKIKFIQLTTSATDITDNCDTNESEFEDYETSPIDAINVYSTSNDLTQTVGASNPTNAYPISGNIFLLSFGATFVTRVLQATLSAISPIVYTPAKLELIIGDLSLQIGDCVQIYRAGNQYIHYIFGTTLYDSLLVRQSINCPATGSKLDESSSASNDPLIFGEMFTKMEQTVEGISAIASSKNKTYRQSATPVGATVGDLWYFTGITTSTRENGKWYRYNGSTWELTEDAGIGANRADLQIQSTQIEARVTKTGGTDATFSWSLTADGFILKSNNTTVFQCNSTGINVSGSITATSGYIGGWVVTESKLYHPHSAGNDGVGLVYSGGASRPSLWQSGNSPVVFYAGARDDNPFPDNTSDCYFGVLADGSVYCQALKATGATITGSITATSGTIGGCEIKDGKLVITSANITGKLTIGQLPSSVATTSDIPTNVSELYNDSGYQNQTGVVSIVDGRITADYVEALGITVDAAQISGKLTASQIDANNISASGVNISGVFHSTGVNNNVADIQDGYIKLTQHWPKCITEQTVSSIFNSFSNESISLNIGVNNNGYAIASIDSASNSIVFTSDKAQLNGTWIGTSSEAITSDMNKKHDISNITEAYEVLFDSLIPRIYKYDDGTSNRLHTGFIAQEVENAIEVAGKTTQDFAGFVRATFTNPETSTEEEVCCLRYEEFISLNTWEIQKLKARVAHLEELLTAQGVQI